MSMCRHIFAHQKILNSMEVTDKGTVYCGHAIASHDSSHDKENNRLYIWCRQCRSFGTNLMYVMFRTN